MTTPAWTAPASAPPAAPPSAIPSTSLPDADPTRWGWRAGLRYGALGLPLAFVALPLYVLLPNHYATAFGVPLAVLGALLLAARGLDAIVDPWIGRRLDATFAAGPARVLRVGAGAAGVLALGFAALFFPPATLGRGSSPALLTWCAAALLVTCLAYSVLSVAHQAWGARLGGSEAQQARVVGWREGLALVGVLLASVLPATAGLPATTATFAALLGLGVLAWTLAPRPPRGEPAAAAQPDATLRPWALPEFRRLMAVYLLNGTAGAVPATLVLFFIRDRLQLPQGEPLFLGAYFAAGAASVPLWLRAVRRLGLARAWLAGMGLATATFVFTATLGAGDGTGFALVCIGSGLALGADLALPSALLAGVVQRAGWQGRGEGACFGWWALATKLNLALAAGLALPLLALLGYTPGTREPAALQALGLAYALLPCALKLAAAALLWWAFARHPHLETPR